MRKIHSLLLLMLLQAGVCLQGADSAYDPGAYKRFHRGALGATAVGGLLALAGLGPEVYLRYLARRPGGLQKELAKKHKLLQWMARPRNRRLMRVVGGIGAGVGALGAAGASLGSDSYDFFKEFVRAPGTVGAIAPSGASLVDKLVAHLPSSEQGPRKILEVGAGTGVATSKLVSLLQNGDTLDVVESEQRFADLLKAKFGNKDGVRVHQMFIQDFPIPEEKYDAIVMGIPFNALPSNVVKEIWQHCHRLAKPGALITYFSYIGLPDIKKLGLRGDARKNFIETRRFLNAHAGRYGGDRHRRAWVNMPPAYAYAIEAQGDKDLAPDVLNAPRGE